MPKKCPRENPLTNHARWRRFYVLPKTLLNTSGFNSMLLIAMRVSNANLQAYARKCLFLEDVCKLPRLCQATCHVQLRSILTKSTYFSDTCACYKHVFLQLMHAEFNALTKSAYFSNTCAKTSANRHFKFTTITFIRETRYVLALSNRKLKFAYFSNTCAYFGCFARLHGRNLRFHSSFQATSNST